MIRFKHCYRILSLVLIVLVLMFLSACWVVSIEGLDESEGPHGSIDHDRSFEPALVGAWLMQSPDCVATINITAENDEYVARETSEGEKCTDEDKKEVHYHSKLYKLNQHLFLDVTARHEDVCTLCFPVHWIFLITIEKDTLTLAPIQSDWLGKKIDAKALSLSTLKDDSDVITATSKELKDFCRRYADDKEAFILVPPMILKRKQAR